MSRQEVTVIKLLVISTYQLFTLIKYMTHATYFAAVAPDARILRINQGTVWPNLVPVVVAICEEMEENSNPTFLESALLAPPSSQAQNFK